MTQEEIRNKIAELTEELTCLHRVYGRKREELDGLDREIMTLYKEKWSLERKIVPVKVCPTYKPRTRTVSPKELDPIKLENLTPAQLEKILAALREQKREMEE